MARQHILLLLLITAAAVAVLSFTHLDLALPSNTVVAYSPSPELRASTTDEIETALHVEPAATTSSITRETTPTTTPTPKPTISSVPEKTSNQAIKSQQTEVASTNPDIVSRVNNPYPYSPQPFPTVNDSARAALVNIICMPHAGALSPISGSGVIIDPRGIVLTNAHVAQYVLLSELQQIDLKCEIRTGSPAVARWKAKVLFMSPQWVAEHLGDVATESAESTGERDYALLYITGTLNGDPLQGSFPFVPPDTRQAIAFDNDPVLVASYPAEFLGGLAAQNSLYAASSVINIKKLLTFVSQTVDILSLGGVIEAQSGSSGGAVVNQWGHLVGIIVTTSPGATTGSRDLRAITLSYISRDLAAVSGHDLTSVLSQDPKQLLDDFNSTIAPSLLQQYLNVLFTH